MDKKQASKNYYRKIMVANEMLNSKIKTLLHHLTLYHAMTIFVTPEENTLWEKKKMLEGMYGNGPVQCLDIYT